MEKKIRESKFNNLKKFLGNNQKIDLIISNLITI